MGPQGCALSVALQGLRVGHYQCGGKIPSLSVLAQRSCISLPRQGLEAAQAACCKWSVALCLPWDSPTKPGEAPEP